MMMMMMMMMLMLLVKILDKPKVDSDDPTWPGEEITVNYLSFTPAMQLATGSLLLRPFFSPQGKVWQGARWQHQFNLVHISSAVMFYHLWVLCTRTCSCLYIWDHVQILNRIVKGWNKTKVNHALHPWKPMSSGADELVEPRQLRREKLWERCSSKRARIIWGFP